MTLTRPRPQVPSGGHVRPPAGSRRPRRRSPSSPRCPTRSPRWPRSPALWPAVLIPAQIALVGVPGSVAFHRTYLPVPFLSRVPDLLVAEWYRAAGPRLSPARRGTASP